MGVPAALVAALFIAVVHQLEHWLWHDLPERLDASGPPWYLVLGLPIAGACIVLLARMLLPGDGGHEPLGGISVEPTPLSHAPLARIGHLRRDPRRHGGIDAVPAAWMTMAAIDERFPLRRAS